LRDIAERGLIGHAEAIASKHGIELNELPCSLLHGVARARREFWSQLYESGVYTLRQISDIFGRDPKTVSAQVRKHEAETYGERTHVVIGGKERSIAEWAKLSGTPKAQIRRRLHSGMAAADAVWGGVNVRDERRSA